MPTLGPQLHPAKIFFRNTHRSSLARLKVIAGKSNRAMVLDNIASSPHRRPPSFRKQFARDEVGSWSTLVQRHRYLLTALLLLAFLCTVYLYFAVTLGSGGLCSGLTGNQKDACLAKLSSSTGKLKFH